MADDLSHLWTVAPFEGAPKRIERTFKSAAESYLLHGGSPRYLDKIVDHFQSRMVDTITSMEVRLMGLELYKGCKASTINRQALSPARSVLYHAHELGWCHPLRIKSLKTEKPTKHHSVTGDWITRFINQADADGLYHLSAMVFFMQHTAARVSEACNVMGEHIDLRRRTALLVKTKTNVNEVAFLTDECTYRIHNLGIRRGERVFRYSSRWSVNDRIRAVCRRAGIEYWSSHSVGRHTYATNAIKLGLSVKVAMDGGRWKSPNVFLNTYVHLDDAGRTVADRINAHRYANI